MNREIAERWVADLRAGPPQAIACLYNGKGHCCLGRLCVLAGLEPEQRDKYDEKVWSFSGEQYSLPKHVSDWAGLCNVDARFNPGKLQPEDLAAISNVLGRPFSTLADMNDDGWTFAQIADFIEKYSDLSLTGALPCPAK